VRPPYDTPEGEKTAEAIRQADDVARVLCGLLGDEVERITNTTE
jgi:hypothetical protein